MNDILNKIISIEEKAQQIIESATEEEKNIEINLKKDMDNLENDIIHRQKEKLEQLKQDEFKLVEEQIKKTEQETQQKINAINKLAEENKDQWSEELVKRVLRR